MTPGHTSLVLTRLAAFVSLAITLLPPLGFFLVEREGLVRSLEVDARVQAVALTNVVGRNPGTWIDAHERLLEAIEPVQDDRRTTRVFDNSGSLVTVAQSELKWPTMSRASEFFDYGLVAGRVEVVASLADIIAQTILILFLSAAFGFLVYVPLRKMPAQALKRASESLVRGELSRSLVDGLSYGVVLTDDQTLVIATNESATRIDGLTQQIIRGVSLVDCFRGAVGEDGKPFVAELWPMRLCLDTGATTEPAVIGLTAIGGRQIWLSLKSTPIRHGEEYENPAVVTSIEDITLQKLDGDRLNITERAVQSSRDAIMITDAENRIISVNDAFCIITGYEESEVLGQRPSILSSGRHDQAFYREMWRHLEAKSSWSGEIWNRRRNGDLFPTWLSISQIRDPHGKLTHYIGTLFDQSERIKAEQEVLHLVRHDLLTGLPNRAQLREGLDQAMTAAERHAWRVGIYFIDLDRFKLINDTLGHEAGDLVLCEVARRLRTFLRNEDTVGRLAGDEYIVFTPIIDSDTELVTIGEHILETLSKPFVLGKEEVFLTTSIGVVVYPDDGADVDTLLSNADTAMHAAKAAGRANFKFFTAAMNDAGRNQLETIRAVKVALERGEFELFYQPQVLASNDSHILGAEALIRWNHPGRGLVPPGQFIPVIEGSRLIIEVGTWVIDQALRQARDWREKGMEVCISINVSPMQFQQDDFVAILCSAGERHAFVAGSIRVEVTESLMLSDPEATIEKMNEIRKAGFRLSLDDFGTGYSSLSYLARFPFDELKIDRSFVCRLTSDRTAEAIINAVIVLGHALGLQTVAEGVETNAEADILRGLGCDQIQGYLYGRPMPRHEFESRLRVSAAAHPASAPE